MDFRFLGFFYVHKANFRTNIYRKRLLLSCPCALWAANITNRLVKTPKVYFLDTGLAAYLCRWPNAETLANGAMAGSFFETFAISEIIKSYYNVGKDLNLYYYRDIDKKEIDLLIVNAESIYPIEIKKAKNPNDADKNFRVLSKFDLLQKPGILICMADELMPYNRDTWLCPISLI